MKATIVLSVLDEEQLRSIEKLITTLRGVRVLRKYEEKEL